MKILYITVRSDFGGGPRHIQQLIENLPAEYDIYLAYPQCGIPYSRIWDSDKRIKGRIFIPYRKFSFSSLLKLKRFISQNEIDIVHSHGNGAGIYSRMLKMIGIKAKVVHTYHGISEQYSSKWKYLLSRCIGKFLQPFSEKYIAVSNGEKRLAINWGFCRKSNCKVIYNGIEDYGYSLPNYDSKVVVTLTRYDYQKNMELCLDIVRMMKSDGLRFVWVGDGEEFDTLENIVKKEQLPVEMVGFQPAPVTYLKEACVYLSTSRFEGLPYALIEAASIGLPIVATDVKGNNEVAINGENGFTFNSIGEGVSALRKLFGSKNLYEQMSKKSREIFEEKFTVSLMINELLKEYQSV